MQVNFPFRFDGSGRTAVADDEKHIRDLIEQVLFTQLAVHGALQQWVGDVALVEAVDVRHEEAVLCVTVRYIVRRTQERRVSELVRAI
jgi:uncharacterized protein